MKERGEGRGEGRGERKVLINIINRVEQLAGVDQCVYWYESTLFKLADVRTQFPTILDEKKHIRFNSLYQENEPVDAFYRTVKRAGKLLKLTDDLIIDQFFRGLSADNIFEAERFHNLNPDDLTCCSGSSGPDWNDDGYEDYPDGDDPGAPAWTLDDHQNAIDLIMGYKCVTSKILTNQLHKAKDRRRIERKRW
ncbi:hypothetical protein RhiirA4_483369 [Rhizophagus irregularis]|uniref:Retrotransposon gag domain-containing protein n=1 Tax=Rhizophagus irregularis TaxID=588596 RepID=A0A2I1HMJ5_9GLOM|nr:hypothetical protein RhiirA4_483369 [Rhizophagus irregularis]